MDVRLFDELMESRVTKQCIKDDELMLILRCVFGHGDGVALVE
jgi:hypothetical protein